MEIELRQVMRTLMRRWWLILLITVLSGLAFFVTTSQQSATYSAATTLLVNPQQVTGSTENSVLLASQSQAQTYVLLVESGPVLDRVNDELGLPYTRTELSDKIEARVVLSTQLIEISVSDPSAEEAARIANSVAAQFESQIEDLTIGRLEENLSQLMSELNSLQSRQSEISQQLADLDTDANADNADIQKQIRDLEEERTRGQETIADLQSSVRSINAALATTTSPVEVADEAQASREPDSPKPLLMTALGLFLGLLVGAGVAVYLEFTDKKIRPETDIEELANSRLLATIPVDRDRSNSDPVVISPGDDAMTDAIRLLRTRLVSAASGEGHRAIVFTSAGGTDQTSTIVALLGHVMAQSGLRTVIVDANLRHPRQHGLLGSSNESGLTSALSMTSDKIEGIDAASVAPRLSLVTAGTRVDNPAALVSSQAFASLIGAIRNEANVVLVDTPPAIEASDALSIASVADGVVLVGQYGATLREDVSMLSETLLQDGKPLLGVVMVRP